MPAYKDKNGRWRFRFTYKGKRYGASTPTNANTKAAALALERQLLDKLIARVHTGVMPTVAEFAPRFVDYQREHTKPLTLLNQESVVTNHIVPHIGKLHLDDVTVEVIDGLKATWECEASTKNQRLRVLRRMLSVAVDWRYLASLIKIRPIPEEESFPRFLTDAESFALVEAAGRDWQRRVGHDGQWLAADRWRSMLVVALRTGMRIGELRGLQWGDIDLLRARIRIARTIAGKAGHDATSPKSNHLRTVPLTADAIAALRAVMPARPRATDFVWPGRKAGRSYSEAGCDNAIRLIAKLSGVERPDEISWHTMRHTFASQLAIRGTSLKVIQELLGHSSITMTEIYAHLLPGATHHNAVQALDTPYAEPTLAANVQPKQIGPGQEPE